MMKIKHNLWAKITLLAIVLLGFYLRWDQFLVQVLIDDEWHAVHKIIKSTPEKFINTFGIADYSIPLTLLYWFEAKYFGLTEFLMRWPMMLFGLVSLLGFSFYIKKHFNWTVTLIFALLIATSPLLIHYSRIARPYAITLFLVYFNIVLFYQYYQGSRNTFFIGFMYALSAALALWLHLIVGFFLVAPFVVEFVKLWLLQQDNKVKKIVKLLYLGIPTLILMLVLILPPLLNDMDTLSSKSGTNLPTSDTLLGFLYLSYGTSSSLLVIVFSVLTLIALPTVIKKSDVGVNIIVGFLLTLSAIYLVQPVWVQIPVTFTRYLLPVIPLFLLMSAIGLNNFFKIIKNKIRNIHLYYVLVITIIVILLINVKNASPLSEWLRKPNTNTLHSLYSIDFRKGKNIIEEILYKRPVSLFWKSLKQAPLQYKIVVAPWYFESYNWDGPVWERISEQEVLPGYLTGICFSKRGGETPQDPRFRFQNMGFIANKQELMRKHIDYVIFQKSKRFNYVVNDLEKINQCLIKIKEFYGPSIYEDELIAVFTPNPIQSEKNK